MFPTFIGILDIQSWWEVPSIAHFCSLFRAAFNLLDFDIEDLEEALLTDGGAEGRLLQELIVKLLEGCLPNETRNDISTFNYQMFLRRLFRKKCQDYKCENPFNTDVDFELLPLRQKVEILRALCDFRLDAEDVECALSNLDSDSLRVEPLGHDRKNSAYWYFYGTRLYREDYIDPTPTSPPRQKLRARDRKRRRRRSRAEKELDDEEYSSCKEKEKEEDITTSLSIEKNRETVWQVVCFSQQDWARLVDKFKDSDFDTEKKLYHTLAEDFLPEIPKLFELKEKQQRCRLLQRNNSRVLRSQETEESTMVRAKIKSKSVKSSKKSGQSSKAVESEDEAPILIPPPQKKGRQTNNSLASAVGQIVIEPRDEIESIADKKGTVRHAKSTYVAAYPYTFGIEEEERRVGMHKILESLKDHEDAWPFIDPVDEEYAPRYYSVVRKPMDLSTMEEKLDGGSYKNLNQFKRDFRLIVDNCRQYNGSDNEYTEMAVNLTEAFDRAVDRYLDSEQSSDESPSVLVSPPTSSPRLTRRSSSPSIALNPRKKQKKKSNKALKSKKNEKKSKSQSRNAKNNENDDDDEDDEDNIDDDDGEDDEKDIGAISKSAVIKSKRKKYTEVEKLLPKSNKKLSAKEQKSEVTSKHTGDKNNSQKEIMRNSKEEKLKRKRKDDFEDDHEPVASVKSKSKRIEKKGFEENLSLIERIKKNKANKKVVVEKEESEEDNYKFSDSEENGREILEKVKKTRKKDSGQKSIKSDRKIVEKVKEKEKKSSRIKKQQEDENLKNGQAKKGSDKSKNGNTSPKKVEKTLDPVVSNEDLESLDRLKDRISQRRKEEKIKIDRVKNQTKQSSKSEILDKKHKNKKVPSNGNTNNENHNKVIPKRGKLDKFGSSSKENDKSSGEKKNDEKIPETKKSKNAKGKEESPAIQALNKATEQTLNDINKWLDDAPRLSEFSSGSDSPVLPVSTTDLSKSSSKTGPDAARKRPNPMKMMFGPTGPPRPKKIQRTIDRLQPGKSKGNLLLKKPLPSSSGTSEVTLNQSTSDVEEKNRETSNEPKLSLGSVLKNADSIQLICKSIVSSPNPHISNDEDEERPMILSRSASPAADSSSIRNQMKSSQEKIQEKNEDSDKKDKKLSEVQKPKSATPNLSAWFKAFGAPKSKKKEETEPEEIPKKEEIQEPPTPTHLQTRQRRLSAGGSSVSESVSSFSQESPPGLTIRSPQSQPSLTPTGIEQQPVRAGFYQDALSTGSSPYNSPYYATPPRYSAQLPPTPSPQNHPLSPAYPSSAAYDQNPVYPQGISQASHQVYQKPSTPENSSEVSYTAENYPQLPGASQKVVSPVYPQHSPQPSPQSQQSANFSQPSPGNPPSYSQPSPQSQHSPYSQTSPQPPPNYSQPQPSPQQPNSPYSQTSPKPPPPSYSQVSPQTPSPYSHPQPSPQFAQPSPQPPANYSQPSPQPPVNYSQPSPQRSANYSQPSPQPSANYSQPSPQPSANYSQPSPQPSANYSQPSPQPSANYSQPSPQPPPAYSQPSPQPATNYSQPSPQVQSGPSVIQPQLSPAPASSTAFEQTRNYIQPASQTNLPVSTRAPANYSQPSPRQSGSNQGFPQTPVQKPAPEEYHTGTYSQGFKSDYTHPTGIDYHPKPEANKIPGQLGLNSGNHQAPVYQSNQLPPPYGNNFSPADSQRSISRINPQEPGQQVQERHFETSNEALKFSVQQRQEQSQSAPSQLLSFQQNLGSHEGIYQPAGGFQAPPYPMPNPTCRPVYPSPHYYDASAKTSNSVTPTMAPVKKRMYTEPTSESSRSHSQEAPRPEQFNYDQMMSLQGSDGMSQFDGGFGGLSDSVVNNPAYRLGLGLVGKNAKEQQLLSIPTRPTTKDLNYSRPTGSSELDMNLFQNLQSSAKNLPGIQGRREAPPVAQVPPPVKQKKRSKKAQQQQQQQLQQQQQQLQQASSGISDGQVGMPGFPQYPPVDTIGQKNPPVIPPGGSAFNFTAPPSATNSPSFYDKDASAAAAAFAFLDEFRNPNNYYSIQQQQQAQQQQVPPVTEAAQQNKLNNQPPRNYPQHPFLHSTQRSAAYGPPVSAYVTPHGPNLSLDPAAYQQYLHSLYALQPPSHHRPSWL